MGDSDGSKPRADRGEPILAPLTLGEALRLLLGRGRLSRDELAALCQISTGAISNYLNDASVPAAPALRTIVNVLADVLRINPGVLWVELGGLLERTAKRQPWPEARRRSYERLLMQIRESLSTGDLESFLSLLRNDVVLHIPGRNPMAGEHKGRDAAQKILRTLLHMTGQTATFDIHDVLANGEHSIVLLTLRARRGERFVYMNSVVVCHLKDAKIAEVWVHPHDQYLADIFWS